MTEAELANGVGIVTGAETATGAEGEIGHGAGVVAEAGAAIGAGTDIEAEATEAGTVLEAGVAHGVEIATEVGIMSALDTATLARHANGTGIGTVIGAAGEVGTEIGAVGATIGNGSVYTGTPSFPPSPGSC